MHAARSVGPSVSVLIVHAARSVCLSVSVCVHAARWVCPTASCVRQAHGARCTLEAYKRCCPAMHAAR